MINGVTEFALTLHALDAVEKTTPTPLPPPVAPIVSGSGRNRGLTPIFVSEEEGRYLLDNGGAGGALRLLRLAHTLKGAARVVRQSEIANLAHLLEDVLVPLEVSTPPLAAQGPETIP